MHNLPPSEGANLFYSQLYQWQVLYSKQSSVATTISRSYKSRSPNYFQREIESTTRSKLENDDGGKAFLYIQGDPYISEGVK